MMLLGMYKNVWCVSRGRLSTKDLEGLYNRFLFQNRSGEHITMDFVSGLSRSKEGCDYIWVIVNRLTKSTHFLPIISTNKLCKLVKLFIEKIVRLHGVPVSIVSDRDPRFTTNFWASLYKSFGTKLHFSTTFILKQTVT